MHRIVLLTTLIAALCLPLPGLDLVSSAQAAEKKKSEKPLKTRKTPAMREQTYKKLSQVQEFIDVKDLQGALEALGKTRLRGMNAYELGQLYNMWAYVYFSMENYPKAIEAYQAVLAQVPGIPEVMEEQALYAVGQLYFILEDYRRSIEYLHKWFAVVTNPGPQPYVFLAQAYYQLKRFREAIPPVMTAIDIARQRGQRPKENWWLLLRAMYYELEDWRKVLDIVEILVVEYPKKDYWVQLSGIYGQEGYEKNQVAALEMAWLQGWLEREQEYVNLSGLFMQEEVPYRAARVLKEGIDREIVELDSDNWRMLGQAWQMAQEVDRAIAAYKKSAELAEDGDIAYRLSQLFMDKDDNANCLKFANLALRQGELRREEDVQMVKGMCQFNLDRLSNARDTFAVCRRTARRSENDMTARQCQRWIAYVDRERSRRLKLRDML
jgi:tetratricopeptide (TPR) repeat protein